MKLINDFLDSLYEKSTVPAITKDFIERLASLSEKNEDVAFQFDSVSMKLEEYLKLIEETEENINPFVAEMEVHAQNLKTKFKSNGLNHFECKMRRKALISVMHKINRNIRLGKSIESINDLIGMEITIHTTSQFDTERSLAELRKAVRLTFEYFTTSTEHKGSRFSLCDAAELKDALSFERLPEEVEKLRKMNPNIFLPREPLIDERFRNFGKDYAFQPKLTTAYQGVQFVLKSSQGIYFEIQIKTQPMRDYLDVEDSPGNHKTHKKGQNSKTIVSDPLQFNVGFDPNKMKHIYGFRKNPQFDRSGIITAVKWDMGKSNH